MRIYTQLFLVFLFTFKAAGQHTEFGISLNSGLFSFRGPSAEKVSFLNISQSPEATIYYTNNPYGSKNALLYGLSINVQRITKKNIIFGTDLVMKIYEVKYQLIKFSTMMMLMIKSSLFLGKQFFLILLSI